MDTTQAEAEMIRLQNETDHLHTQRDAIDRRLAEIEERRAKISIFLEMAKAYAPENSVPSASEHVKLPTIASSVTTNQRQAYGYWPKVVQASIDILHEAGKPLHTRQLLVELKSRGFEFTVSDPVTNLSNKLGRSLSLRSHGKLGWHLADWPQPTPSTQSTEERLNVLRALNQPLGGSAGQLTSNSALHTNSDPFFGKGLPDAATELLIERGRPTGNAEIALSLADAGFPFTQKDHAVAVEGALRRRLDSDGDVARVAPGTWAMRWWYDKEQLDALATKLGGMPGRDARAHLDATRAAVYAAKARGVRFGRRSTLDAEQMARARQLINEGVTPKEVADSLGMHRNSVLKWVKKWVQEDRDAKLPI